MMNWFLTSAADSMAVIVDVFEGYMNIKIKTCKLRWILTDVSLISHDVKSHIGVVIFSENSALLVTHMCL